MIFDCLLKQQLAALPLPAELVASNRLAYHRHRLLADLALPPEVNALQREWLHQILVSASIAAPSKTTFQLAKQQQPYSLIRLKSIWRGHEVTVCAARRQSR